jgi:hypothetical protein
VARFRPASPVAPSLACCGPLLALRAPLGPPSGPAPPSLAPLLAPLLPLLARPALLGPSLALFGPLWPSLALFGATFGPCFPGSLFPLISCASSLVKGPADSGGGRDKLVESFGWSIPCEGFAGSGVEEQGDLVELVLGVDGEVGAFGEELADEAVPVLVGASLPG